MASNIADAHEYNQQSERSFMKEGIHPKYEEVTITCGCGNEINTMSTSKDMHMEICSACHPFYSGKQKIVDTAGRVERFRKKYGIKKEAATEE